MELYHMHGFRGKDMRGYCDERESWLAQRGPSRGLNSASTRVEGLYMYP